MPIQSLLIANRGEIAVRIIRAAQEMGIRAVQAFSEADQDSLTVQLADDAILIGPAQAHKSYLNIDAIIAAAHTCQVDAIHPGYGFLAENPKFAQAVQDAGLQFIGPSAQVIATMGDKVTARQIAIDAGVPTVPGSQGRIQDFTQAKELAETIGYPILIKASAGGGGRGIRIIHTAEEFDQLATLASTEAQAAFGDGGLYIEKYIAAGRHIEVQIMGDGERVCHLYERECSLQRNRQKVWEEAPASAIATDLRTQLCQAAIDLAHAVRYRGAGTVEFLYDPQAERFYFLEMNTRIQVEHPTTEMITGVDLIREMIAVADGKPLSFTQSDLRIQGHAIEVRINAEDPCQQFLPYPGHIESVQYPGGPGVRFDTFIFPGYTVSPFYDSLLGKLIVWGETRQACLNRLKRALGELHINGIKTTKVLHQVLAEDRQVAAADFHTQTLEPWLTEHVGLLEKMQ